MLTFGVIQVWLLANKFYLVNLDESNTSPGNDRRW